MSEQIEQQNNKVQTTAEKTTAAAEQVAGFQVVNEGFTTREAMRKPSDASIVRCHNVRRDVLSEMISPTLCMNFLWVIWVRLCLSSMPRATFLLSVDVCVLMRSNARATVCWARRENLYR